MTRRGKQAAAGRGSGDSARANSKPRAGRAAGRRRIVLGLLGVGFAVVAGLVVGGVLLPIALLAPTVLIVGFLVAARRQVRAARRRPAPSPRATTSQPVPSTPQRRPDVSAPGATWEARPATLPTYVTAPPAAGFPRVIDTATPGAWTAAAMLERAQQQKARAERMAAAKAEAIARAKAEQAAAEARSRDDDFLVAAVDRVACRRHLGAAVPAARRQRVGPTAPIDPLPLPAAALGRLALAARTGYPLQAHWGCSAAGSAPRSHRGGQGFESPQLHREEGPRYATGGPPRCRGSPERHRPRGTSPRARNGRSDPSGFAREATSRQQRSNPGCRQAVFRPERARSPAPAATRGALSTGAGARFAAGPAKGHGRGERPGGVWRAVRAEWPLASAQGVR